MERSLILDPTVALRNLKLIGWGAGRDFSEFFPRHGFDLAYTIDIFPENVGRRIHGIEVRSSDALRAEDPRNCLILIYSTAWFEILRQLRAIGPFRAVRSHGEPGIASKAREIIHRGRSIETRLQGVRKSRAILLQGPLHEGITEAALRNYAVSDPDSLLIVSTWVGEDCESISRLADIVLLNEAPEFGGDHSRNLQIRSTMAGLAAAKRMGIERVAKTRTDSVLASDGALAVLDRALDTWPVSGPLQGAMRNRIAVLANASWRYVPYHYSDQVMYGDTDDLINYWSSDYQTTSLRVLDGTHNVLDLSRSGAPPECFFASGFLARNGVEPLGTIEHGWETLRNGFVAIDGSSIGWFWWKTLALVEDSTKSTLASASQLLDVHTHATWRELVDTDSWHARARALDARPPLLADFWRTGTRLDVP